MKPAIHRSPDRINEYPDTPEQDPKMSWLASGRISDNPAICGEEKLAHPRGFEPLASAFGGLRKWTFVDIGELKKPQKTAIVCLASS